MGLNINSQSVNFTGSDNTGYALNLDALRLIRPSKNGQVVSVAGQEIAGDGFGNNYVWLDTATGTDDNKTIIQSSYSGTTGRWLVVNKELEALQEFQIDTTGRVSIDRLTANESMVVPTVTTSDNSGNAASTAYVQNNLSNYLPLTGGKVTGPVIGVTAPTSDSSGTLASTQYVQNNLQFYLPLTGGKVTGSIQGVTASTSDNSLNLATTAYVQNNLQEYLPLTGGVLSNQLTLDNTTNNQNVINFGKVGQESQGILNFFTSGGSTSDSNILVNGGNTTTGNEGTITITSGSINLVGNVTAPTPAPLDSSSNVATTNYVQLALDQKNVVGSTSGNQIQFNWNGTAMDMEVDTTDQGIVATRTWVQEALGTNNAVVGAVIPYGGSSAPSGYIICDGSSFDVTTYTQTAAVFPTGTVPDMRGLFPRGYDPTGNVDIDGATRGLLSYQEGSYVMADENVSLSNFNNIGADNHRDILGWENPKSMFPNNTIGYQNIGGSAYWVNNVAYVGIIRPKNIAFNYITRLL